MILNCYDATDLSQSIELPQHDEENSLRWLRCAFPSLCLYLILSLCLYTLSLFHFLSFSHFYIWARLKCACEKPASTIFIIYYTVFFKACSFVFFLLFFLSFFLICRILNVNCVWFASFPTPISHIYILPIQCDEYVSFYFRQTNGKRKPSTFECSV